jgi:hypothetical protein
MYISPIAYVSVQCFYYKRCVIATRQAWDLSLLANCCALALQVLQFAVSLLLPLKRAIGPEQHDSCSTEDTPSAIKVLTSLHHIVLVFAEARSRTNVDGRVTRPPAGLPVNRVSIFGITKKFSFEILALTGRYVPQIVSYLPMFRDKLSVLSSRVKIGGGGGGGEAPIFPKILLKLLK